MLRQPLPQHREQTQCKTGCIDMCTEKESPELLVRPVSQSWAGFLACSYRLLPSFLCLRPAAWCRRALEAGSKHQATPNTQPSGSCGLLGSDSIYILCSANWKLIRLRQVPALCMYDYTLPQPYLQMPQKDFLGAIALPVVRSALPLSLLLLTHTDSIDEFRQMMTVISFF